MDLTKLYNTIIKINLFKGFNINEIENLLKKIRFQIKSYKKNESIFFRGDPIKHIIILLEGTSKGEMHKFNGDTIIIDYMKPNQIIASAFKGEIAPCFTLSTSLSTNMSCSRFVSGISDNADTNSLLISCCIF